MVVVVVGHPRAGAPEPAPDQRHQHRGVDGDHADAGLSKTPAVDVDDRGRARERLDGADERGRNHEDAREEEQRHADFAGPGHAEAEEVRRRDGHDGEVGEDVEDDEGPEVLRAEDAFGTGERVDLPVGAVAVCS